MSEHDPAESDLLHALPGVARLAVGVAWRTATWSVATTAGTYARLIRAAVSGESAAELAGDLRAYARELLTADARVRTMLPDGLIRTEPDAPPDGSPAALRQQGERLLAQSADVSFREDAHPAYARILSELAPDEARILRLFATEGAQPAVDVRGGALPLNATSHLVAPGLQMIGSAAGCRHLDRVPAYLNNLYRLGLIWFSREPLEDPLVYQVLEAQPDVLEALHRASRGRTVRRSILLTPFGVDFCDVCLPLSSGERASLRAGAGEVAARADAERDDAPAPEE